MPTLRNVNPLGEVDLPLIGRTLGAGEEFDVTDAQAALLLAQAGNYEAVDAEDLNALTIPELEDLAAAKGVDLTGITKKADIIAAIDSQKAGN